MEECKLLGKIEKATFRFTISQVHLDAHLAELKLADQKHEHGTAWLIIKQHCS